VDVLVGLAGQLETEREACHRVRGRERELSRELQSLGPFPSQLPAAGVADECGQLFQITVEQVLRVQ
jgi:hypothetical protein